MLRLLLALLALVLALPAQAQGGDVITARAQDVAAVIRGEKAYAEVFAPSFVQAVPEAQFAALTAQLRAQMGAFTGVASVTPTGEPGKATLSLRFADAVVSGPMQLEPEAPYRVAGLLLNDVRPVADNGETALQLLQGLPGTTALRMARLDGTQVLAAHNADRQLAIGSTFKLYVLAALSRAVARGERQWSDVVELDQRSLPSGQLQDWPQGAPITLHSLATMMIAISDNTATDQLISVLGREAVEAELIASGHAAPGATLPMMTTRELFALKLGDEGLLQRYAAGSEAQRRAILAGLADAVPDVEQVNAVFGGGPHHIGVEWFASAEDIAGVQARLVEDPVARAILGINLGMDRSHFAAWEWAGYKGGSEPGVLNLSWVLRDSEGAWWSLVVTWNNPDAAISEMQLVGIAGQALEELQP